MSKLIADPVVARQRYGVHLRTLDRWDKTPSLDFPKPVYMRGRKYRDEAALDKWDLNNSREAAARAREATAKTSKATARSIELKKKTKQAKESESAGPATP
jgi:hypothetical protein